MRLHTRPGHNPDFGIQGPSGNRSISHERICGRWPVLLMLAAALVAIAGADAVPFANRRTTIIWQQRPQALKQRYLCYRPHGKDIDMAAELVNNSHL
jgi:hypothetical protein